MLQAQAPSTLKLDVQVVSVDVTVIDSKGNLVTRLGKDDLSIAENGISQSITRPMDRSAGFRSRPATTVST
jgi:hypothetical protein